MRVGLSIEQVRNIQTKNKFFLVLSVSFVIVINLIFIYFVYERIIKGHFSGAFALLDIRKTISSGEAGYFYPGIIKQVRDIFAPALIVWLYLYYYGKYRALTLVLVAGLILIAMIFGGQRMPVLVLFLAVLISIFIKKKAEGAYISKVKIFFFSLIPLVLIFCLNVLLGRAGEGEGIFESFFNLVLNLLTRVFATVPQENLHVLPYLSSLDIPAFSLWLSDLSILLPGTQAAFSNELHSYLGGSKQGNAVLGAPVDVFVNAGYIGLVAVPALVFVVLKYLNDILLYKSNPFSIALFIVVFCYLPFCYSLYLFLLNGGLLLCLYGIYNVLVPRKRSG